MKSKTYQKILTSILSAALIASLTPTLALAAPAALEAAQIEGAVTENAPDNAKGESVYVEGVSDQEFSEQGSNSKYGAYIKNPAAKMSKKSLNMVKAFKKRFVTKEFKSNFNARSTYLDHYRKDFTGGYTQAAQKKLFNEFQSAQVKPKGWDSSKKKVDLSKLDTTCSSKADLLITWTSGFASTGGVGGSITGAYKYNACGLDLIDTSKANKTYQNTQGNNKMPFVTRAVYNDEISNVVRANPLHQTKGALIMRSIDANELGLYDSLAGFYFVKSFNPSRYNESKVKITYDAYRYHGWGTELGPDYAIKGSDNDYRYGCIRWGYSYTDKAGKEHKGVWELYEGVDYVIKDHGKNKYIPGKYKIEIIGKGRFSGKIEFTYNVGKLDLGYDVSTYPYKGAMYGVGYYGASMTEGVSNAQAEENLRKIAKTLPDDKYIEAIKFVEGRGFVFTKTVKINAKQSIKFPSLYPSVDLSRVNYWEIDKKYKAMCKKLKLNVKIKNVKIPAKYKKYVSLNKKTGMFIIKKGFIENFNNKPMLVKMSMEVSSPYITGGFLNNKKTHSGIYCFQITTGHAYGCNCFDLRLSGREKSKLDGKYVWF